MCCAAQSLYRLSFIYPLWVWDRNEAYSAALWLLMTGQVKDFGQRLPEECINALAGLGRRLSAECMGWDKAVAGGSNEGFLQLTWSARARAATSGLCYRIFCCRSTDVETTSLRVVQLSQKRKREGRNGVGRTWWQHILEVFSVLFEMWVALAGRELYGLPRWSMFTRFLCPGCYVREKWLPHLLSLGQSWLLKLTKLRQTVGGSTADDVRKTLFPFAIRACITLLYLKLKWWCKLGDTNL